MSKFLALTALAFSLALGGAHAATDQQSKMSTCNAEAKTKELKGEDRKNFMSTCLSAKPVPAEAAATPQQNKMKTCNADAKTKELKGEDRKKFMSECLSAK